MLKVKIVITQQDLKIVHLYSLSHLLINLFIHDFLIAEFYVPFI